MIYNFSVFICGLIFGSGLTISEMINPNKILNFLDISGNFDPSLIIVMMSALLITALGYRLILRTHKPLLAEQFILPQKKTIDLKLLLGASLFGIGWGLSGYCPGPGITALVLGVMDPVYFMIGLLLSVLICWIFLSFYTQSIICSKPSILK